MRRVQTPAEFTEWFDRFLFDLDVPGLRWLTNLDRRWRGLEPFKPRWRLRLERAGSLP